MVVKDTKTVRFYYVAVVVIDKAVCAHPGASAETVVGEGNGVVSAFKFVSNYVSVDFHHRALICPSYYKTRPLKRSGKQKMIRLFSGF